MLVKALFKNSKLIFLAFVSEVFIQLLVLVTVGEGDGKIGSAVKIKVELVFFSVFSEAFSELFGCNFFGNN